jgi:hypothetical protein
VSNQHLTQVLSDLRLSIEPLDIALQEQPRAGEASQRMLSTPVIVDGHIATPTTEGRAQLIRREFLNAQAAAEDRAHGVGPGALYLLDELTPRAELEIRRMSINYVTADGRALVSMPGIYIDVRKRLSPRSTAKPTRTSGGNLFSTRRSQMILCLVTWPHLTRASHREIARIAGISVGMVPTTLATLRRAGFLDDGREGKRIVNADSLIEAWVAAYPTGLREKLNLAEYEGELPSRATIHTAFPDGVVGGEFAVSTIRNPEQLLLYTEHWDVRGAIKLQWRKSIQPNVAIRSKFWRDPGSLGGSHSACAPPLLVYADLLAAGDPRLVEAAQELRHENPRLHAR